MKRTIPAPWPALYRMLHSGRLAGSGRMIILPVDQGFEHGPARSFAANPPGYDPGYHLGLALEAGFSAYACPLGFMEAVARQAAGQIPLILKLNSHESLNDDPDSLPAVTADIDDALRLGCDAIGFTIYPGSAHAHEGYQQLAGNWRPRPRPPAWPWWSGRIPGDRPFPQKSQTSIDVVAYAAQIAAQLGAHIIKVKPPAADLSTEKMALFYRQNGIKTKTLAQRIAHVVQSAFDGRRIVIFSGGAKTSDQDFCRLAAA